MKKLFKWVGISFGGLAVLMILVGVFAGKKPASEAATAVQPVADAAPATVAPAPAAPVAVTVTAGTLYDAYDSNEVAADQKYKGQLLAVSGTVQSIDKDVFNNIIVSLKTKNEFMAVRAYLNKEHEPLAASLGKGQKISWTCTGDGKMVGSPVIRDCSPKA